MPVLVVENLRKVFSGGIVALKNISFTVDSGEIYGLVGPNGAGKTTTLRIIATVLEPTSGNVYVNGYSVRDKPNAVRQQISYLPEEAGAYKYLTGYEFLDFIASFYTKNESEKYRMISEAIEISGLGERIGDKIKTYSKGMLRRLLVAKTLMVKPKLALLDEPTSGIDVANSVRIRDIIRKYAREYGVAVLLSSHNMLEVEYLCDRVGIIHNGEIIAEGPPRELIHKHSVRNLEELFIKLTGG
ncbi:MAG: ABC transporter ATP-binding protein [Desulfurococcaceae archaeon]